MEEAVTDRREHPPVKARFPTIIHAVTRREARRRKVFFQLFFSISAVAFLVLLFTTFILSASFERLSIREIQKKSIDLLAQTRSVFSSLHFWIIPSFIQFSSDPMIARFVYGNDLSLYEMARAVDRIDSAIANFPLVHSIHVFNGRSGFYYSNTYGLEGPVASDPGIPGIVAGVKEYGIFRYIPRVLTIAEDALPPGVRPPEAVNALSLVFGDMPADGGSMTGAVIVNLNERRLRETLFLSSPLSDARLMIVDRDGTLLTHPDRGKFGDDVADEAYIRAVFAREEPAGAFRYAVDTESCLISYVTHEDMGWRFVAAMPYESIVREVRQTRNRTLTVFLILLLVSASLAFVVSVRLYSPIGKLFRSALHARDVLQIDMTRREDRAAGELQYVDEVFRQAVRSVRIMSGTLLEQRDRRLHERMREILLGLEDPEELGNGEDYVSGLCGRKGVPLYVIVLRLDRYRMLVEEIDRETGNSLRALIGKIAEEAIPGSRSFIDIGKDHVALICGAGGAGVSDGAENPEPPGAEPPGGSLPPEDPPGALVSALGRVQRTVAEELACSTTIGISAPVGGCERLSAAYEEAMTATRFRFRYGTGSRIRYGDIAGTSETYQCDDGKIRQITTELRLGRYVEAERILDTILRGVERGGYQDYLFTLRSMSYTLQKLIDSSEPGPFPNRMELHDMIERVPEAETADEARTLLREIFRRYAEHAASGQGKKREELLARILEFIDRNLSDQGLCADTVAGHAGLSTNYTRTFFRGVVGKPLSLFVNEKRLALVCDLLRETRLPVKEIAERAGFGNYNYFFTSFRKVYGCTPLRFRRKAAETAGMQRRPIQ